MGRVPSIVVGVWIVAMLLMVYLNLLGHPTRDEIAAPCRDNGGVAQYVPDSVLTGVDAFVICKDGEVGRI